MASPDVEMKEEELSSPSKMGEGNLWVNFLNQFTQLLLTGYDLPHVFQLQAVQKVEEEIKVWKRNLGIEMILEELADEADDPKSTDEVPHSKDVSNSKDDVPEPKDDVSNTDVFDYKDDVSVDDSRIAKKKGMPYVEIVPIPRSAVEEIDSDSSEESKSDVSIVKADEVKAEEPDLANGEDVSVGKSSPKKLKGKSKKSKKSVALKRKRGPPRKRPASDSNKKSKKAKKLRVEKKSDDTFSCTVCFMSFSTKYRLLKHKLSHGPIQCESCDKTFKTAGGFHLHDVSVHNPSDNMKKCSYCELYLPNNSMLKVHQQSKHFKHDESQKRYLCDKCDRRFYRVSHLNRHMDTHLITEKNYFCPHCNHASRTSQLVDAHIKKMHTERDPFICNICGVGLTSKTSLQEHERRHYNHKSFKCEECEFTTYSMSGIRKHQKIHKQAEYKCNICFKLFRHRFHLTRHMQVHSGEKNQPCTFCNYKCNDASNLRKHIKAVHKITPAAIARKVWKEEDMETPQETPEKETAELIQEEHELDKDQNIESYQVPPEDSVVPDEPDDSVVQYGEIITMIHPENRNLFSDIQFQ